MCYLKPRNKIQKLTDNHLRSAALVTAQRLPDTMRAWCLQVGIISPTIVYCVYL